eukprot:gnl/TRDRNA2_/TRDRNA2_191609_c0_seq1.p1 gnl/TRDRNA2_/TRDRNA2_191609_c0~~gnl/TRDRNA2_/TRDRNA2_191609_c0_seq1.p1  ORF type:complete len:269 (+),score=69.71 gnl/TRDRNA2_/TRDRNA2_191609_c0_seq1:63-869(+)
MADTSRQTTPPRGTRSAKDVSDEDAQSSTGGDDASTTADSVSAFAASAAASPVKEDRVHHLQDTWSFWVYLPNGNGSLDKENWQNSQANVFSFATIEEFWQLNNNIQSPSKLGVVDLSYFKRGIKPAWEEEPCKGGGRWLAKLSNIGPKEVDELWLALVFSVIGETLVEVGSQCLCGIVASIRLQKSKSKVAVWVSERDESKVMPIGQAFRRLLQDFGFAGELTFEAFEGNSKELYAIPGGGAGGESPKPSRWTGKRLEAKMATLGNE